MMTSIRKQRVGLKYYTTHTVQIEADLSGRQQYKVEDIIKEVMAKEELKIVSKIEDRDMVKSGKYNTSNYNDCDEIM